MKKEKSVLPGSSYDPEIKTIYSDGIVLSPSTVITFEVEWEFQDYPGDRRDRRVYHYVSTYDFNTSYGAGKIIEQFQKLIPLSDPDFYKDLFGGFDPKRVNEVSRKITEMRSGYPVAAEKSDAEIHGQAILEDFILPQGKNTDTIQDVEYFKSKLKKSLSSPK